MSSNLTLSAVSKNTVANIIDLRKKGPEQESTPPEESVLKTPNHKTPQAAQGKSEETHRGDRKILWEVPDSEPVQNKVGLHVLLVLLVIAAGLLIFFRTNLLLSLLLILFCIVVGLTMNRKPSKIMTILSIHGISLDDRQYEYKDIDSFWIDYERQDKRLIITMKKWYLPRINISIANRNPLEVRSLLIDHLDERRVERGLIEALLEKFGF
ncbi:MAG TPA: hypothetical protein DCS06_01085 [Candidatus Yanofskybacteria bacterium]|nr:hypothetical protein [Candidatus Yanofskybacteria bacterium]